MKNILLVALLTAIFASGCAMATGGHNTVSGFLYSSYQSSGNVGTAQPGKTGKACASSILGWVATGDASIEAAKKIGGISQVANVDYELFNALGFYATTCTIVTGQ